ASRSRVAAEGLAFALVLHGTALLSPLGWRTNLLALIPSLTIVFSRDAGGFDPVRVRARRVCAWGLAFTALFLNWDVLGGRVLSAPLAPRYSALLGLLISACAVIVPARRTGLWRPAPQRPPSAAQAAASPRSSHPGRSWAFLVAATLLALGTV